MERGTCSAAVPKRQLLQLIRQSSWDPQLKITGPWAKFSWHSAIDCYASAILKGDCAVKAVP